ncbi:MAG: hypothetical protein NC311_14975 [Muribaculaceae bacterium]|nr:hypothetical protein [Muribaculaceae bacterium]
MEYIDFFKLQAKNLLRDYKTQETYQDGEFELFKYSPKYFDIEAIFGDFGNLRSIFVDYYCDESNFKLGNAQHIIALLVGFNKWTDLINAKEKDLKLAKFLFDNQDKISVAELNEAMQMYKYDYNVNCDTDFKLEWLEKTIDKYSFSWFPVYSISHLKKHGWESTYQRNGQLPELIKKQERRERMNYKKQLKQQREAILAKEDKGDNIVCLHCGNVCPANEEFIHQMGCDGEFWDLVPTDEPVKIEI